MSTVDLVNVAAVVTAFTAMSAYVYATETRPHRRRTSAKSVEDIARQVGLYVPPCDVCQGGCVLPMRGTNGALLADCWACNGTGEAGGVA